MGHPAFVAGLRVGHPPQLLRVSLNCAHFSCIIIDLQGCGESHNPLVGGGKSLRAHHRIHRAPQPYRFTIPSLSRKPTRPTRPIPRVSAGVRPTSISRFSRFSPEVKSSQRLPISCEA